MSALIAAYGPHQLLMAPILAASAHDSDVRAAYDKAMGRTAAALEAFILQQRRKRPTRELSARETATALTRMVERTVTQELRNASIERRARMADTLAQITWHAVFPDEQPTARSSRSRSR
jgi:hypothetical protein